MVAAVAILNSQTRLRLKLQFFWQTLLAVFFIIPSLIVLYSSENYEIPLPSISEWKLSLSAIDVEPGKISFTLVLIWAISSLVLLMFKNATLSNFSALRQLVDRLVDERRYLEICDLINDYMPTLSDAANERLRFQYAKKSLENYGGKFDLDSLYMSEPKLAFKPFKFVKFFMLSLSNLLPKRLGPTADARAIILTLTEADDFLAFLRRSRPEIIIFLLKNHRWARYDFEYDYFRQSCLDRSSILCREIRKSDGSLSPVGYAVPKDCLLLQFILSNLELTIALSLWKPVGDELIRLIENDKAYQKRLVEPSPELEADLSEDPILYGKRFFELLVATAIKTDNICHMWLMYLQIISSEITEVLGSRDQQNIDVDSEFPSLGDRLLYELTVVQRDWIEVIDKLSENSFHGSKRGVSEKMSIPYWAARDFCRNVRCIIRTKGIGERQKQDRLDSFLRTFGKFQRDHPIRQLLISELCRLDDAADNLTIRNLRELLPLADFSLTYDINDLKAALWMHVEFAQA